MRATRTLLPFLAMVLLARVDCFGQAWVPPKGEGEIALSYQNLFNRYHFNGDGSRHDYGHIRVFGAIEELDYGVTDKFAVNVSLPYGFGKYRGPYPHQLPIDNGDYHGALQDFHVGIPVQHRQASISIHSILGGGVSQPSLPAFRTLRRRH
jgi:hypothetical protein